eukprot:3926662-Alexandrium_andersonii.AAC.1
MCSQALELGHCDRTGRYSGQHAQFHCVLAMLRACLAEVAMWLGCASKVHAKALYASCMSKMLISPRVRPDWAK